MGVEGAVNLGEQISKLQSLSSLSIDFSYNSISDEGAAILGKGLSEL